MPRPPKQIEIIDGEITLREGKIYASYIASIEHVRAGFTLREITEAIQNGQYSVVLDILGPALIAEGFSAYLRQLQDAFQGAADMEARYASPFMRFDLNISQSNTARFLTQYRADQITALSAETRAAVTQIIIDGVNSGDNPLTIARRIRSSIGLDARRVEAVSNYRLSLVNNSSRALGYELRDARYDPRTRAALAAGKPLPATSIDVMVERYAQRALKSRAETIARTEAIRMLNQGQYEYWQQAVADGKVSSGQLKRFWTPTYDGRLRDAHRAIPQMNPLGVGQYDYFQSPLGAIMYPGDPSATPANTINCRCAVITRIVSEG